MEADSAMLIRHTIRLGREGFIKMEALPALPGPYSYLVSYVIYYATQLSWVDPNTHMRDRKCCVLIWKCNSTITMYITSNFLSIAQVNLN